MLTKTLLKEEIKTKQYTSKFNNIKKQLPSNFFFLNFFHMCTLFSIPITKNYLEELKSSKTKKLTNLVLKNSD